MGLDTLVRSVVATADSITKSLQSTIQHYPWISQDNTGKPVYGDPVPLKALVEHKQRLMRNQLGEERMIRTYVAIISPVEPNGAAGRDEPIDPRDKIVCADGTTGPIVEVLGLIDPSTSHPYLYEVYLGWRY